MTGVGLNLIEACRGVVPGLLQRERSMEHPIEAANQLDRTYELIAAGPDRSVLLVPGDTSLMMPTRCGLGEHEVPIVNWAQVPTDKGSTLAMLLGTAYDRLPDTISTAVIDLCSRRIQAERATNGWASSGPVETAVLNLLLLDAVAEGSTSSAQWDWILTSAKRLAASADVAETEGRVISASGRNFQVMTLVNDRALPHIILLSMADRDALAIPFEMKVTLPDTNRMRLCEIQCRIATSDMPATSWADGFPKALTMFSAVSVSRVRLDRG